MVIVIIVTLPSASPLFELDLAVVAQATRKEY
jgi:hypothetical protein